MVAYVVKIVRILVFFCMSAMWSPSVFAIEYQVVFFSGAGGVEFSDVVKDIDRIRNKTDLPVKRFFPSGIRKFPKVKKYTDSDFNDHAKWMENMVESNPDVHYIFVVNSQGWIPFSKLAPKLGDYGIKNRGYDVILNQPSGSWATGLARNRLPHHTFSFDDLDVQPEHTIFLQAPNKAVGDKFDEPDVKATKNFFTLPYGPIVDQICNSSGSNCSYKFLKFDHREPLKQKDITKHGRAVGVALEHEIPNLISVLARKSQFSKNAEERKREIKSILSLGKNLRREFYKAALQQANPVERAIERITKKEDIPRRDGLGGVSQKMEVDASSFRDDNSSEQETLKNDILNSRPTSE